MTTGRRSLATRRTKPAASHRARSGVPGRRARFAQGRDEVHL